MAESPKKLSPLAAIVTLVVGGLLYAGNLWLQSNAPEKQSGQQSEKQIEKPGDQAVAQSPKAGSSQPSDQRSGTQVSKDAVSKGASAPAKQATASADKAPAKGSDKPTSKVSDKAATTATEPAPRKASRFDQNRVGRGAPEVRWGGIAEVKAAFAAQRSDVFVEVEGVVVHILPLDTDGKRHQNWLFELANGITLKVSHNIDLADPIPNLRKGMRLRIRGEYEYNEKGGVLHWTHHDPARRHPDGFIEVDGKRYG